MIAPAPQQAAPVDTLTDADFEIPILIDENDIHSLEAHGKQFAPWAQQPDFDGMILAQDLVNFSRKFTGTRYRAGGKRPGGFDCSGLVGYVFREFGMNLGASSAAMSKEGEKVTREDLRPGDLLFFSRSRGGKTVGHVGMVTEVDSTTGRAKFIHATTGRGVIESNFPDGDYYSARFITARRIF